MVLGGVPTAQNVSANGNVFIANGANVGITTTGAPCQIEFNNKTGELDFELLKETAGNASAYLASIPPNMILDKEGHLKPTDVKNQTSFTTFKFDSCAQTGKCGVEGEQASDPTKIFFGNGNWTGPEGDETYPTDKPIVFNVSVHLALYEMHSTHMNNDRSLLLLVPLWFSTLLTLVLISLLATPSITHILLTLKVNSKLTVPFL